MARRTIKKARSKARGGKSVSPAPKRSPSRARRNGAADDRGDGSDTFLRSESEVTTALVSGAQAGALEDYFGANQYQELRVLAREASARSVRGGDRVLILPGIMGSHLGYERGAIDDAIWLDPIDIAFGKLLRLKLGAAQDIVALGVILFTYLKLKLRLKLAGYDAQFFPYDWRQGLTLLGRRLSAELDKGPAHIVAHSMGGLVTRAALAHQPKKLRRVVMLGTPNFGSFAPIEAFRGTNSSVRKVAALGRYKIEDLAGMFATFDGLLQMTPSAPGPDYFDLAFWPPSGARPTQASLTAARKVMDNLPTGFAKPVGEQNIYLIAGYNQKTKVAAKIENGEFVYTESLDGDGTVPVAFAQLPGLAATYFVDEEHGKLPGNRLVGDALPSILARGESNLLATKQPASRGAQPTLVSETQLRSIDIERVTRSPSARERRDLIHEFAAAEDTPSPHAPIEVSSAAGAAAPAPDFVKFELSDRLVIGREHNHRLEMNVVCGDLTQVDAGCYVVGLFSHVRPGGAASKLDGLMNGAVTDLSARRMLSAETGQVTILPKGRHPLRAGNVAFVGLGGFDDFNDGIYELLGENLIRTFAATRVDDFAMVPFGGSSQSFTPEALKNLMTGFLRGLREADPDRHFRTITLCEHNPARFDGIARALHRLCSTQTFDDVEVTLRFQRLPEAPGELRAGAPARPREPNYLIVRYDTNPSDEPGFTASALTTGTQAAIIKARRDFEQKALDDLLAELDGVASLDLDDYGERLAATVLDPSVIDVLSKQGERPLVIVHDAISSRIPWELVRLGEHFPALNGGLSHRFEADKLSIAKWQSVKADGRVLNILLITDPTGDLPEAAREGERVQKLFEELRSGARVTHLIKNEARREEVLKLLNSGSFDVVHYAGHAFFDPETPSRAGILCAGNEVLSGADLASASHLPALMFFNACEIARVRKAGTRRKSTPRSDHIRGNVGFAEALLRGGVKNFVGTYWPVGDDAAGAFAATFYKALLQGSSISQALKEGRKKLFDKSWNDWADYIHYGDTEFVLRSPDA